MLKTITKWPLEITKEMYCIGEGTEKTITFKNLPCSLYQSLKDSCLKYGEKTVLVEQSTAITYRQFLARVDRMACSLICEHSVARGDVCAILMGNSIDFCVSFYAINKIGAIALPLSTKLSGRELIYPLNHSEAKMLILHEKWLPKAEEIFFNTSMKKLLIFERERQQELQWELVDDLTPSLHDGAAIIYTSGTMGQPKGAYITNLNMLHGMECYKRILNLSHKDSTVISTPIFNITGLAGMMTLFVYIGGTIYLQSVFDSAKMLKCVEENNITFLHGSPTVFIFLLEHRGAFPALPSLRCGACGSANLPVDVIERLDNWLPGFDLHTVYGLTETSSPATIMPQASMRTGKPGSSGIPVPGMKLRITNIRTGEELPFGKSGEIQVKGSNVISKYLSPTEQEQSFFSDGWFATGDIGMVDEDGYIYIMDRKKDMINRGGEKIYSIEVENILASHPEVEECAVIGLNDATYGECVHAVIRAKAGSGLRQESLGDFLTGKLANYKKPQSYSFVETFPKTESGKISKRLLKEYYNRTGGI